MPYKKDGSPLKTGVSLASLTAIEHPTSLDISWAAGIYEGEGSCGAGGKYRSTFKIQVGQHVRNIWMLEKLKRLFGGSISKRGYSKRENPGEECMREWHIHGARARGFAMTIFTFLSPYRREQVKRWLR